MNTRNVPLSALGLAALFTLSVACDSDKDKPETKAATTAKDTAAGKTAPAKPGAEKLAAKPPGEAVAVEEVVENPVTKESAKKLIADAKKSMKLLADARAALSKKDKKAATEALKGAHKALDEVIEERPTIDIAVSLWKADKELDVDASSASVDTVPLFASVDRVEEHLFSADDLAAKKKTRGDATDGVSADDKHSDIDLIDANLIYSEVDLPVAATHVRMLAALQLLEEGKLDKADGILADAQAGLEVLEVIQQAPEIVARQAVWDGEAAFARGDLDLAKRELTAAKAALQSVTEDPEGDEGAKKFSKALLSEIDPQIKTLEAGNTEHASALQKLKRSAWSFGQRTVARATLIKHRGEQRFALADALMYLEKAQAEGLYDGAPKAGGDLVIAEGMLLEAAGKVAPATKPLVDALVEQIRGLISLDIAPTRDADAIKARHEGLKLDLRMLMFDLWLF